MAVNQKNFGVEIYQSVTDYNESVATEILLSVADPVRGLVERFDRDFGFEWQKDDDGLSREAFLELESTDRNDYPPYSKMTYKESFESRLWDVGSAAICERFAEHVWEDGDSSEMEASFAQKVIDFGYLLLLDRYDFELCCEMLKSGEPIHTRGFGDTAASRKMSK